jgi:hypothetical protein
MPSPRFTHLADFSPRFLSLYAKCDPPNPPIDTPDWIQDTRN